MKKFICYLTVIACLLSVSSCCVMRTTTVTKTVTPMTGELLAELEVRSDKVSETFTSEFGKREIVREGDLKDNAVYEALKKIGADVLVAPQYKITKEICDSKITYTVVVSGYPAFYTNFRQVPMVEKTELRELKEGASYVIVKKSSSNNDVDYDKNIIVVPVNRGCQTLDMDDVTLDKMILRGKNAGTNILYNDEEPVRKHYREPVAQNYNYGYNTQVNNNEMNAFRTRMSMNVAASENTKKACKYSLKQCKDMESAGIALTSIGIGFIGVLFPSLLCTDNAAAGFAFLGLGMSSTVVGVPLWCVGGVNKKKVKNSNYAYSNFKSFDGVQLSLQGGNGIGFALSF